MTFSILLLRLLLQGLALGFAWILPRWQARDDNRRIRENGSDDSHHETFHRQNFWKRGGLALAVGLAAWLPLVLTPPAHWLAYAVGVATYLLLAGCVFIRWFNSLLNTNRGLNPWQVSRDPHAAYFDRTIVALGRRWGTPPEDLLDAGSRILLEVATGVYLVVLFLLFYQPLSSPHV